MEAEQENVICISGSQSSPWSGDFWAIFCEQVNMVLIFIFYWYWMPCCYSVGSVTEEGLDIQQCDVVIRFDLVKSIFTFVHAGIQGKMRDYQLAGLNWILRLYASKQ